MLCLSVLVVAANKVYLVLLATFVECKLNNFKLVVNFLKKILEKHFKSCLKLLV